ncbi:hypothetical protein IFR05_005859 [Cadophora sp. M221]|nr:hypothetical protein IFR05_005859 [Cadophora sp. M221]
MDPNPRDYSREDYAPRDTLEVIYNTETKAFSYKPRSHLASHLREDNMKVFLIPRFCRGVIFATTWRADLSQNNAVDNMMVRRVRLPRKVLIGRNFWGGFRKLYVLRPGIAMA